MRNARRERAHRCELVGARQALVALALHLGDGEGSPASRRAPFSASCKASPRRRGRDRPRASPPGRAATAREARDPALLACAVVTTASVHLRPGPGGIGARPAIAVRGGSPSARDSSCESRAHTSPRAIASSIGAARAVDPSVRKSRRRSGLATSTTRCPGFSTRRRPERIGGRRARISPSEASRACLATGSASPAARATCARLRSRRAPPMLRGGRPNRRSPRPAPRRRPSRPRWARFPSPRRRFETTRSSSVQPKQPTYLVSPRWILAPETAKPLASARPFVGDSPDSILENLRTTKGPDRARRRRRYAGRAGPRAAWHNRCLRRSSRPCSGGEPRDPSALRRLITAAAVMSSPCAMGQDRAAADPRGEPGAPVPPVGAPATRSMSLPDAIADARAHQPAVLAGIARVAAQKEAANVPRAQWQPLIGATAQLLGATANNTTAGYVTPTCMDIPRIGGSTVVSSGTWQPCTPPRSRAPVCSRRRSTAEADRGAGGGGGRARPKIQKQSSANALLDVTYGVVESYFAVQAAEAILKAAEDAYTRARVHRDLRRSRASPRECARRSS